MRKIKWRIYNKQDKKIYYSDDVDYYLNMDGKVGECEQQYCGGHAERIEFVEDKQAIAMLSTGLKDKNGIDIYEGDIVNITIKENIGTFNVPDYIIYNNGYTGREEVFKGEVMYQNFGFGVNDKELGFIFLQPMEDTFFEVTGNKYEKGEQCD